jgi:tape measure domain-containing protein
VTLSAGTVSLPVRPDTTGFGQALSDGVKKESSGLLGGVGKVLGGTLLAGMAGVAAVGAAGVGMAISGGISRALNIQDAQAQLKGLGHSTEDVTEIMKNALASVKGTAFGLDQAAGVAAGAVAAGIAPGDALTRTLKLTADAATIAKVPLNEMGQIVGKVASNQKLTTDVLQQFQDRGVPLLQMVADKYGVTSAAAQQMVSDGKVSFADFQDALEKGVGGAALASGQTARGAFDNVRAALSRVGAEFVTPAITAAPMLFTSIAGAVDAFGSTVKPIADALGDRLTPMFSALGVEITKLGSGGGLATVGTALSSLFDLIAHGHFDGGLAKTLGIQEDSPVVATILTIRDAFVSAFGSVIDTGKAVWAAVEPIFAQMGPTFTALIPQLVSLATSLSPVQLIFKSLAPDLPALAGSLATLASTVAGILSGALQALLPTITSVVAQIVLLAAQVLTQVLPAITAFSDWLNQNTPLVSALVAVIVGAVVAFEAYQLVIAAVQIATEAWAAIQAILNIALDANPIGLIVIAIGALVAGIIWVATQTTFFQDAWKIMTDIIGTAVNWLWVNVISPVFDAIGVAITAVGGFFNWLWESAIKPVVDFIVGYFTLLSGIVVGLWVLVVQPVISAIGMAWQWLWTNVIQPVVDFIVAYVTTMAGVYLWIWQNVIEPAIQGIAAAWNWLWVNVISPVVDFIVAYIQVMAGVYLWLWQNVISPALQGIAGVWNWLWANVISPVAGFIGGAVNAIGSVVGSVFGAIGSTIKGGFDGVVSFVRGIFNTIIGLVNGVIDGINGITSAASSVGVSVPRLGRIPSLAEGATILPRAGGTLVNVAEAGRAESVVDTGKLNRLIDNATSSNTGGGQVVQNISMTGASPEMVLRIADERRAYAQRMKP